LRQAEGQYCNLLGESRVSHDKERRVQNAKLVGRRWMVEKIIMFSYFSMLHSLSFVS
jgi:hypothetical protein